MANSIELLGYPAKDIWSGAPTRAREIAYWVITVYVALAMFYGGLAEVLDASCIYSSRASA